MFSRLIDGKASAIDLTSDEPSSPIGTLVCARINYLSRKLSFADDSAALAHSDLDSPCQVLVPHVFRGHVRDGSER